MTILRMELKDAIPGDQSSGRRELVERWIYESDTIAETPQAIEAAMPPSWSPHPDVPLLYLQDRKPDQIKLSRFWEVKLVWSNELQPSQQKKIEDQLNPLASPWRWTGGSRAEPEATVVDWEGNLILNTAGELMAPQQRPVSIIIHRAKRFFGPNLPQWLFNLVDSVNESAIKIKGIEYPPKTLLFANWSYDDESERVNTRITPVTVELHAKKDGWTKRIPSRGYREIPNANNPGGIEPTVPILVNGKPPREPVLLDANGVAIRNPQPEDVVLVDAELIEPKDWTEANFR